MLQTRRNSAMLPLAQRSSPAVLLWSLFLVSVFLLQQQGAVWAFGILSRPTTTASQRRRYHHHHLSPHHNSKLRGVVLSATAAAAASLKPAALPLMDSGKALARCGELVIDATLSDNKLDLYYGGGLSAAGANLRNAGDCVAQAAALCRFKTGTELVTDELREAATCLQQAVVKLKLAVQEAVQDQDERLAQGIEPTIAQVEGCSIALESAGAALMQRQSIDTVGNYLVTAAAHLQELSDLLPALALLGDEAAQRCRYAAEQMKLAGTNLLPNDQDKPKRKGNNKSWLKGGA